MSNFNTNGYYLVRNFFDKSTVELMSKYFMLKYDIIKYRGNVQKSSFSEGDVASTYTLYGDTLTETILLLNGQKICNTLDMDLTPTYTFTRIYEKGERLLPHVDRFSCEVSATSPIVIGDDRPSTIFVSTYSPADIGRDPLMGLDPLEVYNTGDYIKFDLYPGDVLFYKGVARYHWREPLESPYLIQFFMHSVDSNGSYTDLIFDQRPQMGLPWNTKPK